MVRRLAGRAREQPKPLIAGCNDIGPFGLAIWHAALSGVSTIFPRGSSKEAFMPHIGSGPISLQRAVKEHFDGSLKLFIRSPVKLAVLSHVLPPAPSVGGVLVYRILKDLNPDDYCLLSDKSYGAHSGPRSSLSTATLNLVPRSPARYYQLSSDLVRERQAGGQPANDKPPTMMRLRKAELR